MAYSKKNPAETMEIPFAKRLRHLLQNEDNISPLERKVTQSELAEATGITRQALNAYTLGISAPDISRLCKIADFFGVSCEYLLGRTEAQNYEYAGLIDELGLTEAAIKLLKEFNKEKLMFEDIKNNLEIDSTSFAREKVDLYSIDIVNILLDDKKGLGVIYDILKCFNMNPYEQRDVFVLSNGEVINKEEFVKRKDIFGFVRLNIGDVLEKKQIEQIEDTLVSIKEELWEYTLEDRLEALRTKKDEDLLKIKEVIFTDMESKRQKHSGLESNTEKGDI